MMSLTRVKYHVYRRGMSSLVFPKVARTRRVNILNKAVKIHIFMLSPYPIGLTDCLPNCNANCLYHVTSHLAEPFIGYHSGQSMSMMTLECAYVQRMMLYALNFSMS